MTTIVRATVDPLAFDGPSYAYPMWVITELRNQGIRFSPKLPILGLKEGDIEKYMEKPWAIDRNRDDGVIRVHQRRE